MTPESADIEETWKRQPVSMISDHDLDLLAVSVCQHKHVFQSELGNTKEDQGKLQISRIFLRRG